MTQLDWETSSFNDARKLSMDTSDRVIAVSDGVICSVAIVPQNMNLGHALRDYARGYDGGTNDLQVAWKVFVDGDEINQGRQQF